MQQFITKEGKLMKIIKKIIAAVAVPCGTALQRKACHRPLSPLISGLQRSRPA